MLNTSDNPPKPDIQRLLDLQKLLLSFSSIERKVYKPAGLETAESDIEHSYSLAMLSWFLAPHFPHLDGGKLIQLCLAHDVLETYCGDTFSFDDHAVVGQKEREAVAIASLKKDWHDFPALHVSIDEYEAAETDEAKFIQALDKLQPALMDYLNEGRPWHKFGITFDKFLQVKEAKMAISPEIDSYYQQLKAILADSPHLFPTAK